MTNCSQNRFSVLEGAFKLSERNSPGCQCKSATKGNRRVGDVLHLLCCVIPQGAAPERRCLKLQLKDGKADLTAWPQYKTSSFRKGLTQSEGLPIVNSEVVHRAYWSLKSLVCCRLEELRSLKLRLQTESNESFSAVFMTGPPPPPAPQQCPFTIGRIDSML